MERIAIIPARGGSKRIPGKNIKEFHDLPIIAYSIRAALRSGLFSEVMVSTDSEEIASVAREYGASIPFMRSAATSGDFATTADVIREVLDRYEAGGRTFDSLCCLYATAPFVTPARLVDAVRMMGDHEAAFSCVAYGYPVQRGLEIAPDGCIAMRWPEYASARSQDLTPTYHDAGQFYFSRVDAFRRHGSLWGPDTMPVILPELEVQDLDTPTDWLLAEMKFSLLRFPARIDTEHYTFRNYTSLDRETNLRLLECRNLPSIREYMVNRKVIYVEEHEDFVRSLRTLLDRAYYAVYERDGGLIGSVNVHAVVSPEFPSATYERGIWLRPAAQGYGHAKRLLKEFYARLAADRGVKRILTEVFSDNNASLRLEKSLGAKRISDIEAADSRILERFLLEI